ncbi:PAS domain S-box protein [Hydrogenophaga sp. 5NK40-0174]|uniref:PAS domain S-box protein n=1 Tax=Hydrogenophaga sp. 5NK40-0174 TaxID=3127649 RepID=UPI003105F13F
MSSTPQRSRPVWEWAWNTLQNWQPSAHNAWLRYGAAIALTVLAAWLRILLAPAEEGGRFLTFTLAGAVAAYIGGLGPGLVSTALGTLLVNFFLVKPYGELAFDDVQNALILNFWHLTTQVIVVGSIWLLQQKQRKLEDTGSALRTSRKRLQQTFQHAAAGIAHIALDGHLIRVNQQYCDLLGYTEAELSHLRFQDLTHPDDIELDEKLLKELRAGTRDKFARQKRYLHRSGEIIWAQLTTALIRDDQGRPDYLISVVQDITPYKRTEEALQASRRLIRQAHALIQMTTWEGDIATGRYKAHNNSHVWIGMQTNDFSNDDLLAIAHPDDRERLVTDWRRAIDGDVQYDATYRAVINGEDHWLAVRAEFERDDDGKATRAYGVTRDVTKQILAEKEIRDLNDTLERRIRERTHELRLAYDQLESYSYAVAHDLRSPLRVINGFAQAIVEDVQDLGPLGQTHLKRIMNASAKMGVLIDGLLKLSQYSRGEVHRSDIDVSGAATRVLEEMSAGAQGRRVRWTVAPHMATQADPGLLDALLQNLIGNAWKYTSNTEDAHIRIYERDVDGKTYICVQDNGPGFDMGKAEKLFQPFQRLHMEREFEGLGIGLATVRRIVDRHGGDLWAESAPGEGATFCFTLAAQDGSHVSQNTQHDARSQAPAH